MSRTTPLTIICLFASLLAACSGAASSSIPVTGDQSALQLTVESPDGESAFRQGEEPITYNYVITNTGSQRLSGPVIVDDPPRQVACPQLNTVGNLDDSLDFNESITCTAYYTLSEADKSSGSLTNRAKAIVGGAVSNEASLTLGPGPAQSTATPSAQGSGELSLVANASPQNYSQAGETITFSYVITNTGDVPVGPAQFMIADDRLGTPLNCGPADTTLVPGQTLTCSAAYTITDADLSAADITSSATASGGGQTSAPASATVTNLATAASPTAFSTPTAAVGAAPESTQSAPVIPTAAPGSSGDGTPGAAASAGAVNVIDMPPGVESVLLTGIAPAGGSIRYSLNATQGQELLLNLVVTTNQIALVLTGPDGAVLKPGEAATPWTGTLPSTGDYLIDVIDTSGIEGQPYMLELRLSPAN